MEQGSVIHSSKLILLRKFQRADGKIAGEDMIVFVREAEQCLFCVRKLSVNAVHGAFQIEVLYSRQLIYHVRRNETVRTASIEQESKRCSATVEGNKRKTLLFKRVLYGDYNLMVQVLFIVTYHICM